MRDEAAMAASAFDRRPALNPDKRPPALVHPARRPVRAAALGTLPAVSDLVRGLAELRVVSGDRGGPGEGKQYP